MKEFLIGLGLTVCGGVLLWYGIINVEKVSMLYWVFTTFILGSGILLTLGSLIPPRKGENNGEY